MLCKCLNIYRSIYYYHKEGKVNKWKLENQELDIKILEIYNKSKKRYGAPKIKKELEKSNIFVSIKRVWKRIRF